MCQTYIESAIAHSDIGRKNNENGSKIEGEKGGTKP